jgi:hypothetical protein
LLGLRDIKQVILTQELEIVRVRILLDLVHFEQGALEDIGQEGKLQLGVGEILEEVETVGGVFIAEQNDVDQLLQPKEEDPGGFRGSLAKK